MKRVLSAIAGLCLLLAAAVCLAGPASPDFVVLRQPDGDTLLGSIRGDEHTNWIETSDGYAIVRNPVDGYWEYAVKINGRLEPSGVRAARDAEVPKEIERGVRPDAPEDAAPRFPEPAPPMKDAPPSYGTWDPTPVSGNKKLLFLLVSFQNRAATITASAWNDTIFSTVAGAKSVAGVAPWPSTRGPDNTWAGRIRTLRSATRS